jgi:hypothetical protein
MFKNIRRTRVDCGFEWSVGFHEREILLPGKGENKLSKGIPNACILQYPNAINSSEFYKICRSKKSYTIILYY